MPVDEWPVLVRISSRVWLSIGPDDPDRRLWICVDSGRRRQLDLEHAVGCLPLLERPYVEVRQELEYAAAAGGASVGAVLEQLPGRILDAALIVGSDYWLRLACEWLTELGPSQRGLELARAVADRARGQDVRHKARRLHRTWSTTDPSDLGNLG